MLAVIVTVVMFALRLPGRAAQAEVRHRAAQPRLGTRPHRDLRPHPLGLRPHRQPGLRSDADPNVRGVPFLVIILAVIAILMSYVSMNTRFGRYAYAIGGNREAARLSGINIKKSIFRIYVTMGALIGVSGIALAAYVGSGTTAAGGGYELDVIASCILGGTSTLGGEGTVFGAIIGALIMQSLGNGLQMLNVNSNLQYMIKGFVLILAVWADISNKKKKS